MLRIGKLSPPSFIRNSGRSWSCIVGSMLLILLNGGVTGRLLVFGLVIEILRYGLYLLMCGKTTQSLIFQTTELTELQGIWCIRRDSTGLNSAYALVVLK
jgi:uncharacterized membrane protein YvlD (DUF360 family)